MTVYEINFDGIVGLTHNYSGLSIGNIASIEHKNSTSSPKEAALQGLSKMKFMLDLGLKQAVLPPHERPHVPTLKALGFSGSDEEIIKKVSEIAPHLLSNCGSSSAMWTANAATVSPSLDCEDGRVHLTPANLTNKFHRSIESAVTTRVLKTIFKNEKYFMVHEPLPAVSQLGDEGAANHTRFAPKMDQKGLELFVFGKYAFEPGRAKPRFFPARQTDEASKSVARLHRLSHDHVMFVQQSPIAIDSGVFHNDVISVGNQNVLLYHEQSFFDGPQAIKDLAQRYHQLYGEDLCLVSVSAQEVTIQEAVRTYLFNSQLVTLTDGKMALIAPIECEENKVVKKCIDRIIGANTNPIKEVHFLNVRQSMQNGGGPACLRLRVPLNKEEINNCDAHVFVNDLLIQSLTGWINKHYRDRLEWNDLADPKLLSETRTALDELTQILKLGSVYDFQR